MATAERFDVLVIGAGPAGMAAAIAARATAGDKARIGVVDDNATAGGQIWRGGRPPVTDRFAANWFTLYDEANIASIHGTQIVAAPAAGELLGECDGRAIDLRYKKLVLATGARTVLAISGRDATERRGRGGLQALIKCGLPVVGKRIVVAGSGPLILSVAAHANQFGAIVPLIAEQAPWHRVASFGARLLWLGPSKLRQGVACRWALRNARYLTGCWPTAAHGGTKVEAVTLQCGGRTWTEPCDILACGFGLVPNLELPLLLGCKIRDGAVVVDEWQESSLPGVFCAGEITGVGGAELAGVEGMIAGRVAAGTRFHFLHTDLARGRSFASAMNRAFRLRDELRHLPDEDTFVCRCEDVTYERLQAFSSWRAAKLQTRCGMGPCQGRVCGAAAEFLFGWKHESVRPPILPANVGTLAQAITTDRADQPNPIGHE